MEAPLQFTQYLTPITAAQNNLVGLVVRVEGDAIQRIKPVRPMEQIFVDLAVVSPKGADAHELVVIITSLSCALRAYLSRR
jgi:hypothetical protein